MQLATETRLQFMLYIINFVLQLLLTSELHNTALGFYGRHVTQQKERIIT